MSICFAITDADWALTKDVITAVTSALGVVVAAWVGIGGLYTWKTQLRGKADHELGLRMLAEVYKFEMILNTARSPHLFPHEVEKSSQDTPPDRYDFHERLEAGFERRIQGVTSAFAEVAALGFNAQALWGRGISKEVSELEFLKNEYSEYVRLKVLSTDPREPKDERMDHKIFLEGRRSVFENLFDKADEYGRDLKSCVQRIEGLVRPKLIK
ncbi:hypothetical protein [Pseudomonas putida]|uniref:hypothetical protein n=1 Tax=Pseudomonas putida TaxID=303 RepID=UPI0031331B71